LTARQPEKLKKTARTPVRTEVELTEHNLRFGGCMSGSELEITANQRVVFTCSGGQVHVDLYKDGEKSERRSLIHSEAAKEGKRIEDTGDPGNFPIPAHVKSFGRRLKEYGENGC
jgi:hypothetical protein